MSDKQPKCPRCGWDHMPSDHPLPGEALHPAGLAPASGSASLAERCYAFEFVGDELFERINMILGCNSDECLKDGFVWGALDTWWDSYDGSVEVIRPPNADWMTAEQAAAILQLGFACVFESIGQQGRQWLKCGGFGECSPRDPGEVNRLRRHIAARNVEVCEGGRKTSELKP